MKVKWTINQKRDGKALPSNKVDFFYGYGEYFENGDTTVPEQKSYVADDGYMGLISEEKLLLAGEQL